MAILKFKINRYNPDDERRGHYEQEYDLDVPKGYTVLDCLNDIKWKLDGTLSYRRSCRSGICGSCAMTINGVNNLACETQALSLKSNTVTIEPLRGYPVVKDLVVSLDPIVRGLMAVNPYMINKTPPPTDQERLQSPEQRDRLEGLYECILCGSCTSACPSFWADKAYLGPHAFLKAYRFVADSRDEDARAHLEALDDKHGLWRCHTIFNCVEACPKGLNPTRAIAELKKEIVKEKMG